MHNFGQVKSGWITLLCCLTMGATETRLTGQSALCGGNLGDNIFTSGTFGSGVPNVVLNDPGYAPGFNYTSQVPPDDGEYTITNDIRDWSFVFPTWLRIGDNDIDPDGYMMVVNASFAPGIFYEQEIDNLCENTRYEFSSDVINIVRNGVTGHILPNVSFLIDDVLSYASGQIPQDEKWHTYGFTFTTGPGQFSVKLSLRNNAPGGIGNDLALDNISFKACGPASSVSIAPEGRICENSLFPILTAHIEADTGALLWQMSLDSGLTWNAIPGAVNRTHQINQLTAGDYYFRYIYSSTASSLNNPKCRIVSDIIHVEIVPVEFLIQDTICEGLFVMLGDSAYGETGIYQQLFTASNGCDSLVTLNLLVMPDPPIVALFDTRPTTCEGAEDGAVFLVSVDGTRPPFFFYVNDSLIPPPNTIVNLPAGTYIARIENEFGCFDEAEVVVDDGPAFDVLTIEDTTIVLGHSINLSAWTNLPASFAAWTPAAQLICPTCLVTLAMPIEDQTYVIHAGIDEDCSDRDSVTIRVDRTPVIYIPNVFSPNGDGINDQFLIGTDPLNIRSILEVLIFDRWGGIIARAANLFPEGEIVLWDGETRYGPAMPGSYVYLIRYTLADNSEQTVSGDVTLIK